LSGYRITTNSTTVTPTAYIKIPLNTTGFQTVSVFLNFNAYSRAGSYYQLAINYSTNGGASYTALAAFTGLTVNTWYASNTLGGRYLLPASCDNNPNVVIQVYGYRNSFCAVDNVIMYALNTTTSAGSMTLPDFGQIYDGCMSNPSVSGSFFPL